MRRDAGTVAFVGMIAGMVAALLILGGCGVTAAGSATTSGSTATSLASPTASTLPTGAKIVQGLVTVTLGKSQLTPADAITVYINNGLPESIFVANHQSSCSLVTIELQSANGWHALAPCRVMTPTGFVEIHSGTTNTQQVIAPGQPPAWPSGTYRVRLAYAHQRFGTATIIYSGLFTVA